MTPALDTSRDREPEPVSIRDLLIGETAHRIRRDIRDLVRVEGFEFARDTVAYILNSEAERVPARKDNA